MMFIFALFNAFQHLTFRGFGLCSLLIGLALILTDSWLIIVMHEVGHATYLWLKKIPIRSIYIPFFTIYFGKKMECKVSRAWSSEGLVIPDMPVVHVETEFERLRNTYLNFLLAGPIASVLFGVIEISGITYIQHTTGITNYCVILILITSLKTSVLLKNCFKELNGNMGDLIAVERVKKDSYFFACYVYCCYFFSEKYKSKIAECIYVKEIIKKNLVRMSNEQLQDEADLLDEILYRSISGVENFYIDYLNKEVYEFAQKLLKKISNQAITDYITISTYLHALMYISIVCHKSEQALQLYHQSEDFLTQTDPLCRYLHSQIRYLLGLEKDLPQEIYPVTDYENWSYYVQYAECEKAIYTKADV